MKIEFRDGYGGIFVPEERGLHYKFKGEEFFVLGRAPRSDIRIVPGTPEQIREAMYKKYGHDCDVDVDEIMDYYRSVSNMQIGVGRPAPYLESHMHEPIRKVVCLTDWVEQVTIVNGKALKYEEDTTIKDGSILMLGGLRLVFHVGKSPPVIRIAPSPGRSPLRLK